MSSSQLFCGAYHHANARIQQKIVDLYPDAKQQHMWIIFIPYAYTSTQLVLCSVDVNCTHVCIVIEERACVQLQCEIIAHDAQIIDCRVDVCVEDDAQVEFVFSQNAQSSINIIQTHTVGNRAHLQCRNITCRGQHITHHLVSHIKGQHARCDIDWLLYARGIEKYTISACNTFYAKEGGGEIIMKGIAQEHAHIQCNGLINICSEGMQTDTYLTEHILMLDPTAKVDAIPGLEIKTNDVKASHSATISKITAEDLFYFAARGIPEKQARDMYIEGFLLDRIQNIHSVALQEFIVSQIQQKHHLEEQRQVDQAVVPAL